VGDLGVAGSVYDLSNMQSLESLVGVIHELPLPKVSYLNPAMPGFKPLFFVDLTIDCFWFQQRKGDRIANAGTIS
jgi:hypothetical protein